ncbi:LytR/AlgR family response regulator transcription factor [Natranaerofaba carboxydovora]|uniref:LytR/AlgR family response regulator transcription factor n=1 Tax=Natranaerofaba carboxydovora TaxID=2742683 RepID=UPI001F140179|nr:LytTR family DNA-binding domain-containing protein [Natranaerofaba carboxydovora]UMZ74755.1 Transcriptional regulatory protein NatR [Natranaerofaba carboxydovora]
MLKALILEDDDRIREFIKKLVSEVTYIDSIFDTGRGKEAIEIAKKEQPDIVILDIGLSGEDQRNCLNGIEVAKNIHIELSETYFIFVTAHSEYALDSFAVHPFDYILKPIDKDRFKSTLNKLVSKIIKEKFHRKVEKSDKPCILIEEKKEILRIPFEDITMIEKEKQGRNTIIHTYTKSYTTQKPLQELEQDLDSRFVRVHRSFIVNKEKIIRVTEGDTPRSYIVELAGTTKTAYVSRYKLEELKRALK